MYRRCFDTALDRQWSPATVTVGNNHGDNGLGKIGDAQISIPMTAIITK